MEQKKTDTWAPDQWLQADTRMSPGDTRCECTSRKQQENRYWDRTLRVPEGMKPVDIITAYPYEFPFPLFHAGQMGVKKHDVECIASAMADPNLRWSNMGHFSVVSLDASALDMNAERMKEVGYNPNEKDVNYVLISGHHRFLAYLFCGMPPSELPPIHIRTTPLGLPYAFPWSLVEWGR